MWIFYALLSAFFAALTAIFAKIGVKDIDSNLATAIRTVIVLILSWGIVLSQKNPPNWNAISRHTLLFLILSGLATGCSWLFYFKAIQLGNVSQVAPIDKLSVALTIVLAFIFLREPISIKEVLGATLIILGSIVLIFK